MEPLLTAQDVADLLQIPETAVHRFCREGELGYYTLNKRGDRRFTGEHVKQFLAQRSSAANAKFDRTRRRPVHSPQRGGECRNKEIIEDSGASLTKEIEALCR